MISNYEKQYIEILRNIYDNGYADGTNERTGISTKRLPNQIINVDLSKEFPILKSKRVFAKTADREIDWIMRKQSNNIHDLKAKIWDEWADPDGSIGKAYGYQVAKPVKIYLDPIHKTPESYREYPSQVHYVLDYLKEQPNGRWAKISLWNVAELADMNLVPCCFDTTWNLDGGRLNCVLIQRSGDFPYGVPFNTTQYACLLIKFAKHLGVQPGILTHVIADAHIYANQMEGVKEQLDYYTLLTYAELSGSTKTKGTQFGRKVQKIGSTYHWTMEEVENASDHIEKVLSCIPRYFIPLELTNFWDMDAELCKVENYIPIREVKFGDIAV